MPYNPSSVEVGDIVPETPAEQNAFLPLGKFDLAQARAGLASKIQAYEPSYTEKIRDEAAKYIGYEQARKFFGGSPDELIDSLNPITGLTRIPGTIADSAVGFMDESKKGNYLPAMGHALVGELNVLPFAKPIANLATTNLSKLAKSDLSKSLAEMAYNQYMEKGIPIPGLPQQFNTPGALYAVKPKGGNTPLNLGSTLPLEEQSRMGAYFSESQIKDPMELFERRLKSHFGGDLDRNNQLQKAYEEHLQHRMEEQPYQGYHLTDEQKNELKKQFSEEFTQAAEHARLSSGDLEGKKLYSPSEIEAAAKHYNDWVMGPMKNYITKQMGTGLETDPLLKVMNDAPFAPHEILGYRNWLDSIIPESADRRRGQFLQKFLDQYEESSPEYQEILKNSVIGKKTATTPFGQIYEDYVDRNLYAKGFFSNPFFANEKDFPGMKHLKPTAVITDFLSSDLDEALGFKTIQNRIINDVLEGKIDPSKLSSRTPANVVQDIIKEVIEKQKALKKNVEAYHGWRKENHNSLPSDVPFGDSEGNLTNKKLIIFDSKLANENPDLVTRNISQETKDLNHCVGSCGMDNGKYLPMVEPHTGVPNKAGSNLGPGYLERIQKGHLSIASMRAPNGESKATLELNPIRSLITGKKDQFRIGQLKGLDNTEVVGKEYINDLKNWLNQKNQTGELLSLPFDDIKNLPGVHDLYDTESLSKLIKSSEKKDNDAVETYLKFANDKLEKNDHLRAKYNSGNLTYQEIMEPYLPRFATSDDIINKLAPK
jgi:hypothetical protein